MSTGLKISALFLIFAFTVSVNLNLSEKQNSLCLFNGATLVKSSNIYNYKLTCGTKSVSIDLNYCLQNNRGNLQSGTGFTATCSNCMLNFLGAIICNCMIDTKVSKLSTFDIVSIIRYQNNNLSCVR